MSINPWQVESIQAFYFLKCPECTFTNKEESDFQTHAIENHPLSITFFEKSSLKIREIGILDACKNSESNDRFIRIKEEVLEMGDDYENPENSEEIFQIENDSIAIKMEPEFMIETDPLNLSNSIIKSEEKFLKSETVVSNETTTNKSRDQKVIVKRQKFIQKLHPSSDSLSKKAQDILNESLGISNVKSFKCSICNSGFTSNQGLSVHFAATHEGENPFKVQVCEANFTEAVKLKSHLASAHEGQKPYNDYRKGKKRLKCPYKCDYNSVEDRHMKIHIQVVHEGKKPFKCTICDASFTKKSYMVTHIASVHEGKKHIESKHEKKRPYKCSKCDACFTQNHVLKKHITSVHEGKKDYQCPFCDGNYERKDKLKLHISTAHEGKQFVPKNGPKNDDGHMYKIIK